MMTDGSGSGALPNAGSPRGGQGADTFDPGRGNRLNTWQTRGTGQHLGVLI